MVIYRLFTTHYFFAIVKYTFSVNIFKDFFNILLLSFKKPLCEFYGYS